MKVGFVCAILCCIIAAVLAKLCGLGIKVQQIGANPMATYPTSSGGASPEQSAAALRAYFTGSQQGIALPQQLSVGNQGSGFGGFFGKREPSNWDEALQFAGDASSHGDYARAEDCLNSGLRMVESENPNDIRVATTASYLANVERRAGQLSEAEKLYKKALAIDEKQLPANNPDIAQVRRDLADVLRREGNVQEATKLTGRPISATPHKPRGHGVVLARAAHRRSAPKSTQSSSQVGFGVSGIFGN